MKKLFKDWTVFELILLIASPVVVTVMAILFHGDWFTTITSIIGILCALLLAKGLIIGQFFGIAIAILYSIVSFNNGYYGEMIIYLALMLPMYIWAIVEWFRHKDREGKRVEINTIGWKEWVFVSILAVGVFVGLYFLLRAFNTNLLIISTLSVVDNLFAIYLLARRSKYGFVSYIINDLILIVLWGIPVIEGNVSVLPMLFNPVINLINDVYGVYNWNKIQKQQ